MTERTITADEVTPKCSFCLKDYSDHVAMIAGPNGVFICFTCAALCVEIVADRCSTVVKKSTELPKEST